MSILEITDYLDTFTWFTDKKQCLELCSFNKYHQFIRTLKAHTHARTLKYHVQQNCTTLGRVFERYAHTGQNDVTDVDVEIAAAAASLALPLVFVLCMGSSAPLYRVSYYISVQSDFSPARIPRYSPSGNGSSDGCRHHSIITHWCVCVFSL